ncbi:MAG: type I pullulanase [Clostridiales bacterium]|nr:type I pullulanase [Clostridiales bacterium]
MKKNISIIVLAIVMVLCLIVAVACNNSKGPGVFTFEESESGGVKVGNDKLLMPTDVPASADEPSIMIHYWRSNAADYTSWGFWLWADGADGQVYNIEYQDSYGSVTIVKLSTLGVTENDKVGIIAREQAAWNKDTEADRFINLSEYTIDSNNYYHVYLYQGDGGLYKNVEELTHGLTASFVSDTRITVNTKAAVKHIELWEGNTLLAEANNNKASTTIHYDFAEGTTPDISQTYTVKVVFKQDKYNAECKVGITALYESEMFDEFNYDGELGAIYSSASTTFKVWSPVSNKIVLNIYQNGDGNETPQTHEMSKGDKGVFSVTVNGDLAAKYYTYTVYNDTYPSGAEIVDPYAKSAGLSGKRGQIVNFDAINSTIVGWNDVSPKAYDANELVVWETHVADVTSSETWKGTEANRKKFLGMIEQGTTYEGVKTGFDHIVELGVNAVQLVPIFDQSNNEAYPEFNWGYNPLNYNVLEGSYSSNASDGYVRIKEFKQLVQAFNGANINIIMDVVYNHVSAAIGSNFDVLMPGYYFRYDSSGDMSNGSGCGNETASDHYMFRKFMIDSVCFWAQEYKLGGFRFDLMGLHDIETMNQLAAALKKINPSIIIYGEPWTGGNTPLDSSLQAKQSNTNKFEGYGQFNDQMRDSLIMGGLKAATDKGWATGGTTTANIANGLKGFTNASIKDLYKTVNYVTCHDNYTLHDRIIATGQFGKAADVFSGDIVLTAEQQATIKQMAMLANSVVFSSNGVNFMLAGEEFLRSKAAGGAVGDEIHNSYESSYKVNELDYALKVENADMFANYQKLIAFKKMFVKDFGLNSNEAVAANYAVEVDGSVITITITAKDNTVWKIVHANGSVADVTADFAGYTLYLDTLNSASLTLSAETPIAKYQTIIASK